jgi:hypothetical protein
MEVQKRVTDRIDFPNSCNPDDQCVVKAVAENGVLEYACVVSGTHSITLKGSQVIALQSTEAIRLIERVKAVSK